MVLARLIYSSFASGPITANDLRDILESARRFNSLFNITGMLCYGDKRFMQYLEGERTLVNQLYRKILLDERHKEVMILDYADIEKPIYKDWSMGFIDADNADIRNFLTNKINASSFQPENMSSTQALQFVDHIKADLYLQMIVKDEDNVVIKGGRIH